MNEDEEQVEVEEEFDADTFDAMVSGTFEPEEIEEEETEQEDEEETEEESEDEEDADEKVDETDETEESEEEDEDEDESTETEDLEDEEETKEDETEEGEESSEEETEEGSDEAEEKPVAIDAKEFEKYKSYYDSIVNTEFKVNGRDVKGYDDPAKIIQSIQMAGGFPEKMGTIKKLRPYVTPLEERGMLEDSAKFDLAMNIMDGDTEAIKQHIKTLELDPMDLDMETINYAPKPTTSSEANIIIEDVFERAKTNGYDSKLRQVIGTEWDKTSFQEFIDNPQVRNDLLDHIESGVYDEVTTKIADISRLDYNGQFGNLTTIQKYRTAIGELQKERQQEAPAEQPDNLKVLEQEQEEAEYKKQAKIKKDAISQQRKKATSISKKKARPKAKPKIDVMKYEGEDLSDLLTLLSEGR